MCFPLLSEVVVDRQAFTFCTSVMKMTPLLQGLGLFFQKWAQMVFLSPPENILGYKVSEINYSAEAKIVFWKKSYVSRK